MHAIHTPIEGNAPVSDGEEIVPAVAPSPYLKKVIDHFGGRAANDPAHRTLAGDSAFKVFVAEMGRYLASVLAEMATLPKLSRGHVLSREEWRQLCARMDAITASFEVLKTLAATMAAVLSVRQGKAWTTRIFLDINVSQKPGFRTYDNLRSALWRRSRAGKEHTRAYDADPVNKARRKADRAERRRVRDDREQHLAAEAERLRAYRARKRAEEADVREVLTLVEND